MRWFRRRSSRLVFALLLPCSLIAAAFAAAQAPEGQPQDPLQSGEAATAEENPAAESEDAADPAAPAEGEVEQPERPKVVIPEEPKTVDPAQFVPPKLAQPATVVFEEASLREVIDWLNAQGIVTLADAQGLTEASITLDAAVDDRLVDDPVYFLLDRLGTLDLDWYVEDDILHITSRERAEERTTTRSHNVGDLYDAGYDGDTLMDLISSTIDPESWPEFGGTGSASLRGLGDVLFVSQNERNHRQILGLLAALRNHGRMTYIAEPPQHERLRTVLNEKLVTSDFRGARLEQAIRDLSAQAGVTIRLDEAGLEEAAVSERTPVTLSLQETKLSTTLGALLSQLDLDWTLRSGAIVVTSEESAESETNVAVFDVRDLSIDQGESEALIDAITSTLDPESWPEFGGTGNASIRMPLPGILVISQSERNLAEVAELLAQYREAIDKSKRRKPRDENDPGEIVTVYYRMPKAMAQDLLGQMALFVEPGTWKTRQNDQLPGTIVGIDSAPDPTAGSSDELAARSTLIVTHTRATHEKIAEAIGRILTGDGHGRFGAIGGGGGGFGGGGLGGGLPADAAPSVLPSGGGGFGGF
ncbi:MAG TPA: hypothetical protein VGN57_07330 [Pirellulaceae bacterium]|jgi:hypothetical protein|nr:hypothetical protein [Pirellulaceae bacterium]